jgi:exodeoxyribonuclease V alpha subunit
VALSTTAELRDAGVLSDLDHELAETLTRMVGDTGPEVRLGVAFASWAVQEGHVCADLAHVLRRSWQDADGKPIPDVRLPSVEAWIAALRDSRLVTVLHDSAPASSDPPRRPLVLDTGGGRLYLHRYFGYERRLIEALTARARPLDDIDGQVLGESLARVFAVRGPSDAEQRRAALLALLHGVSVISGGPGTGKTYTVAKVLLLLQEQARAAGRPPYRIELLAPTGKATQRLGEAIRENLAVLAPDPGLAREIPTTASTLHRALGYQPLTPTRFRHDAQSPLQADVVLVDEASMVDVALMAKLVEAVRRDARLILLGDRHQLASVEAGAILGDLYRPDGDAGYSAPLVARVQRLTGDALPLSATRPDPYLHDCMAQLEHSRRFPEGGAIARLAEAVKAGRFAEALRALEDGDESVTYERLDDDADLEKLLGGLIEDQFGGLASDPDPGRKLARLGSFRFLCAHRQGPRSVTAVNEIVAQHLRRSGGLTGDAVWYDGRPIIVTSNDYQVSLFNGDLGVLAPLRPDDRSASLSPDLPVEAEPPLVAYFPSTDADGQSGLRHLALGRLPPHDTVYAMSVHRAQGSEADAIALVLPPKVSPVLTRELVYTAITRAKRRVTIYGSDAVLKAAIEAQVVRAGIWGERGVLRP